MKARWKLMDKMLYLSFFLLIMFAWFDTHNLIAIKEIDRLWQNSVLWDIFQGSMSPNVFSMWLGVLAVFAFAWYLYSKDNSESLALFLTPTILIVFGVQDLIYYLFSPDTIVGTMGCWADALGPVKIISDLLGETCPSVTAFILSSIVGTFLAFTVYKYLREKW